MGADPATDEEIFGTGYGPEKIISVSASDDARWLLVEVHHGSAGEKVEGYVRDLPQKGPLVTGGDDPDAQFRAALRGDRVYLLTHWNAPHCRVRSAELADPRRGRWREVVPEGESVLTDIAAAGGRLLVRRLEDVQPRLRVHDADGKPLREVALPGIGAVGSVNGDWAD